MRGLPILFLVLGGCSTRPDVAACEHFVKDGLQSPSTYQRVSIKTVDEKVTPEEFVRRRGDNPANPGQDLILKGLQLTSGLAIRNVQLSYDASNAYGTPIRQQAICQFKVTDGKLDGEKKELLNKATIAIGHRAFSQAVDSGAVAGMEAGTLPAAECCL